VLFNSPVYGLFLVTCFAVFWALRKHRLPRALFLVGASYFFYFYGTYAAALEERPPLGPWGWSALCLGIIVVGSTLDYFIGKALGRTEDRRKRKALLLVSIAYYLGVLSLFKYAGFAADSIADLAHAAGIPMQPVHLRLVLPFGISFFTFETMSYTIDVYRREIEPCDRYLDYILFVCFFPHLVAGPIVRPQQMLPQLRAEPRFCAREQAEGLWLIATGLTKKIVIGDTLRLDHVDRVFDNPERFSGPEVLLAVYAYAVQIYADFSGYTDVAIGSALLFGYRLPKNFDAPYTASNLQDFWRRWHISLSSWLRDYLYVPLGGNRGTNVATYRNLLLTMVLGGLWHGASWNFVIWGALHGVALAVTRAWQRARGEGRPPGFAGRALSTLLTFHYVCFAWIFFKAKTFAGARLVLERIATGGGGTTNLAPKVVALVALGIVLHFLPRRFDEAVRARFAASPSVVQGVVLAAAAIGLHLAAAAKPAPFIYGQF
jgi:D-alanyl-lipoteichoic acid acyltransferase DltB (MBOAT superfamily)